MPSVREYWIIMRTRIVLQTVFLLLLAFSSEALFFNYPKKALTDFLQSLKEKKEPKKAQSEVHHYHLHYYPVPVKVISGKPAKAPRKYELEDLYKEQLRSLGWAEHEYKYVPEPKLVPSISHGSWYDQHDAQHSIWGEEVVGTNLQDHRPTGISVHVPLHQEIVLQQPPPKEEKANFLTTFFQKLRRIKNSLFSQDEKNEEQCEDKIEMPTITSKMKSIDAYVVYYRPKNSVKRV